MDTRRYSTREVARLVKLPEGRIRSIVRAGVLEAPKAAPESREFSFDFRDISVLKLVHSLIQAGLPAARVERVLAKIKANLAPGQHLSSLRVSVDHGRVMVSNGHSRWEAESGQAQLTFETTPKAATSAERRSARETLAEIVRKKKLGVGLLIQKDGERDANGWYNLGLELEEDDPQGAYEAYLRALSCNPEHADTMVNLGKMCAESGDLKRAAAYYRQAIRVQPAHPAAHYNLGVTLHDQGDLQGARAAYEAALVYDPHFTHAHYELATVLAAMGERDAADQHLKVYEGIVAKRER